MYSMNLSFGAFLKKAQEGADFTYLGIGTNPHAMTIDTLTDEWDQLIPVFLRDQLRAGKKVHIFHIDPQFKNNLGFLKEYFATKYPRLVYQGEYRWTSPMLDVHLSDSYLYHKNDRDTDNDDIFLIELSEICLDTGSLLVVQEFTGNVLISTFKQCFARITRPELFKKRVLFDITYGNASCMTDLTKYKPIYDENGDFINFTLYTYDEMKELISLKRGNIDSLLRPYFKKTFIESLESHHVNYRRRMNGDLCLTKNKVYSETASCSEIMAVLQGELYTSFDLLRRLGVVDAEKDLKFNMLMDSYLQINMYDWNTQVKKLF